MGLACCVCWDMHVGDVVAARLDGSYGCSVYSGWHIGYMVNIRLRCLQQVLSEGASLVGYGLFVYILHLSVSRTYFEYCTQITDNSIGAKLGGLCSQLSGFSMDIYFAVHRIRVAVEKIHAKVLWNLCRRKVRRLR